MQIASRGIGAEAIGSREMLGQVQGPEKGGALTLTVTLASNSKLAKVPRNATTTPTPDSTAVERGRQRLLLQASGRGTRRCPPDDPPTVTSVFRTILRS